MNDWKFFVREVGRGKGRQRNKRKRVLWLLIMTILCVAEVIGEDGNRSRRDRLVRSVEAEQDGAQTASATVSTMSWLLALSESYATVQADLNIDSIVYICSVMHYSQKSLTHKFFCKITSRPTMKSVGLCCQCWKTSIDMECTWLCLFRLIILVAADMASHAYVLQ